MKKITFVLTLFLCLTLWQANAQFSFPTQAGPFNVAAGSPVTVNLNDMANSAAVPAGVYGSFSITVFWDNPMGNPWSCEADLQVITAAGTVADIDPPSAGAGSNGDPTTLTFEGNFSTDYDPSVDGLFEIVLNQSYGGSSADWSDIMVTINAPTPPPANDLCANAEVLTPGAVFTDNPLTGTNDGATDSGEMPDPGCASYDPADPTGFGGDVWYAVTVPSDGNLTIETDANPTGSGGDGGMAVYTGSCGSLALFECDDDDGPGLYGQVIIEPADALADQVVYIRVWEFGGNAAIDFQVSAFSATLGVDDLDDATSFTYYPNPVKNTLSLSAQNNIENVSMYNMLGQEVMRVTPNNVDSNIDMSGLQTGTYFVKVTIANVTETIRVIKQ